MTSGLERLNALGRPEAEASLLSCCGSREWARRVADERPFRSPADLGEAADRIWRSLGREDWLEAFAAHPRIGHVAGTGPADRHPNPHSRRWSRREQGRVADASPETLAELAEVNREYEERFGHIFIACATGRSAEELLAQARARLHNDPRSELAIAAEEQRRIIRLRLAKLLDGEGL